MIKLPALHSNSVLLWACNFLSAIQLKFSGFAIQRKKTDTNSGVRQRKHLPFKNRLIGVIDLTKLREPNHRNVTNKREVWQICVKSSHRIDRVSPQKKKL